MRAWPSLLRLVPALAVAVGLILATWQCGRAQLPSVLHLSPALRYRTSSMTT